MKRQEEGGRAAEGRGRCVCVGCGVGDGGEGAVINGF